MVLCPLDQGGIVMKEIKVALGRSRGHGNEGDQGGMVMKEIKWHSNEGDQGGIQ